MTRRIEFHEFARDEYIAAARWYEDRQPEPRFGYAIYFELSGDLMFV